MRGRYRQRQMAAIVSHQLDKFGQYTVDVSSSAPVVEDLSEDLTRGKEIAREWHTTGVSMHRPKQNLLRWSQYIVSRQIWLWYFGTISFQTRCILCIVMIFPPPSLL